MTETPQYRGVPLQVFERLYARALVWKDRQLETRALFASFLYYKVYNTTISCLVVLFCGKHRVCFSLAKFSVCKPNLHQ